MDLPYVYHDDSKDYKDAHKLESNKFFNRHKLGGVTGLISAVTSAPTKLAELAGDEIWYQGKKHVRREVMKKNTSKALVMQISGCRDDQTSADTNAFGSGSSGAMSYSFISSFNTNPIHTWKTLLTAMRDCLHKGNKKFTQMPQLSMGRIVDPRLPVVF